VPPHVRVRDPVAGLYQQRGQEPVGLSQVTDPVREHDQWSLPRHLASDTATRNLQIQHLARSLVGDETSRSQDTIGG
jgi:hypothetical protein